MKHVLTAAAVALGGSGMIGGALAADGKPIEVTGEIIDTWCYYSGVMGIPEAVTGSAHHTCAMWCAAGGIPVGMLTEDGTVYMVVKWEGSADVADGVALLDVQAHTIQAKGTAYERDGINYLFVDEVVADLGITNVNHEDFGFIPPFTVPKDQRGGEQ
ncbi:MAG: hypothetical protein AAF568_08190 [Pseudomonadota bacterium]